MSERIAENEEAGEEGEDCSRCDSYFVLHANHLIASLSLLCI